MKKTILYYTITHERRRFGNAMKERFITRLRSIGKTTKTAFCFELYIRCHLSLNDSRELLSAIGGAIAEELKEGRSVEVPSLGTFSLRASAKSADRRADAGIRAFKSIRVNFRPCSEMAAQFRPDSCTLAEWSGE